MSRPKPTILIEKVDKDYKTDQVLASEGIWAIFYQGQPIKLKSFNALIGYSSPKYKRVSFSNPGHAINLAKKMNTLFKCTDFSVVLLNNGPCIFPEEKTKNS